MSKFERIVRDPLVMGGQARIRDTGITVNEVVRLSLDDLSQAEILERFPMLEAEDVHEALGYNLKTLGTAIIHAQYEDLLTNIAIRRTLFNVNDAISAETFVEIRERLLKLTMISKLDAGNLGSLREFYAPQKFKSTRQLDSSTVSIAELINRVTDLMLFYGVSIEWGVSDESIKSLKISNVIYALFALCCSIVRADEFESQVELKSITCKLKGNQIHFMIHCYEGLVDDFGRKYRLSRILNETASSAISLYHLWKLGSELKVHQEKDSVILEFALPIVED